MATDTINGVLHKIAAQPRHAPIAVFDFPEVFGLVEWYWADTAKTQQRIRRGDPRYIGTFHRELDAAVTRSLIEAKAKA